MNIPPIEGMATRPPIRDALWQPAGFTKRSALGHAMIALGRAGMLRPSKRGTSANHLNDREMACIVLALRGEADAAVTKAISLLPADTRGTHTTLLDQVEHLISAGAADVLIGKKPAAVTVALGFGPGLWATISHGDRVERFSAPAADYARIAIRKTITIVPEIFEKACEFAADSKRRTINLDHQGNGPGGTHDDTMSSNRNSAAGSLNPAADSGSPQPTRDANEQLRSIMLGPDYKQHFVCADRGDLPSLEGLNERVRVVP